MDFFEKDLEDIIFYGDRESLRKRGLHIRGKLLRQVRIGNYGIADLISIDRSGDNYVTVDIFELKNKKIDSDCFFQASRYRMGVFHFLKENRYTVNVECNVNLIGRSLDLSGSLAYMPDMIDWLRIHTYGYDVDGIKFKEEREYRLMNPNLIKESRKYLLPPF